ncbi:hypothetical protein [Candidatus Solirubrobacter pratensis]|uniref:hypothetical protein n=1 Tax=Candidatus Solirubrobacter pratensis TaxID=1298857 RepID=UPI000415DA74|nr:hypothetical protein [Candidatus Solirubrobacter pratensis]
MRKLLRYGGVAAGIVLIAIGIGSIVMGFTGRDQVRSDLGREQIVGTPDLASPDARESGRANVAQPAATAI